jgi:hypothetical protein
MHTALRDANLPGASLWATGPHYITTSQNPPATAALLRRLSQVLDLEFDLSELESAGERFMVEVNTALAGNPEVQEYVSRLEEAFDSGIGDDEAPAPQLPKGEDLVMDVEEFLRQQRPDSD